MSMARDLAEAQKALREVLAILSVSTDEIDKRGVWHEIGSASMTARLGLALSGDVNALHDELSTR